MIPVSWIAVQARRIPSAAGRASRTAFGIVRQIFSHSPGIANMIVHTSELTRQIARMLWYVNPAWLPPRLISTAPKPRPDTCTRGSPANNPMTRLPAAPRIMEIKYICAVSSPFAAIALTEVAPSDTSICKTRFMFRNIPHTVRMPISRPAFISVPSVLPYFE